MTTRGRRGRIAPVVTRAAADAVLDQLRRAIGLGRFLPGDRLPPERSLADQLGVSRMTLRAALRVLTAEGIVEIRRGVKGGIVVRQRTSDRAITGPRTRLELDNEFAFRLANERATARLAAARRTQGDLHQLRALLGVMTALTSTAARRRDPGNVAKFIAADADFHLAIAAAAQHPKLEAAVEQALAGRYRSFGAVFASLHDRANEGHQELLEAIQAKHEDRAERAMVAHIQRTHRAALALTGPRQRGGLS